MPDPYVFGPESGREGKTSIHAAETDAWRRAYLAHGDQLGALEAEAARDDEMQTLAARPLSAGEWLRGLLGLHPRACPACLAPYHRGRTCRWDDDPPRPRSPRIRPP